MRYKKLSVILLFSGFALVMIGASQLLFNVSRAQAQCGSQGSSCKNCHEVQGQDPVNADGTGWHESHAFGDFCYLCHAGNQQAKDEAGAHTGMVPPLSDVKASCEQCHPNDLMDRAEVYAVVLGVDLTAGGGSSDAGGGSSDAAAPSDTTGGSAAVSSSSAVSFDHELFIDDPNMVDYAQRYDEIVLGKHPTNWGNIILVSLIALLVAGGGGFVIVNEVRMSAAPGETRKLEGEYPADVIEMLPILTGLKSQTRKTLQRLLSSPQKTQLAMKLIEAVVPDQNPEEQMK